MFCSVTIFGPLIQGRTGPVTLKTFLLCSYGLLRNVSFKLELIIIDIMTLYTSGICAIISIVFLADSDFDYFLLLPSPISYMDSSFIMHLH